ncbi:hypothetical protein Roomu2_00134 [Pseudomonas phage vB_PpuM-Roomu-2]|uniref:Uncharacterized protein n=1 Tax=Pseudomonas phage vB_PpuM-Roomu-2 TaxID=3132621 RepID=A0AAX4MZX7_9CAUD
MGEVESAKVCVICGNVEPPFWWLSEDINPCIPCAPDGLPRQFQPSLAAALEAWGQLEGCDDLPTGT